MLRILGLVNVVGLKEGGKFSAGQIAAPHDLKTHIGSSVVVFSQYNRLVRQMQPLKETAQKKEKKGFSSVGLWGII